MLDLTRLGDWRPPIVETVASTGEGVDELWSAIAEHRAHLTANGDLEAVRRERLAREFHQILLARVEQRLDALLAADRFAPCRGRDVLGRPRPLRGGGPAARRPPARRPDRTSRGRYGARWRPGVTGRVSPGVTGASDSVRW